MQSCTPLCSTCYVFITSDFKLVSFFWIMQQLCAHAGSWSQSQSCILIQKGWLLILLQARKLTSVFLSVPAELIFKNSCCKPLQFPETETCFLVDTCSLWFMVKRSYTQKNSVYALNAETGGKHHKYRLRSKDLSWSKLNWLSEPNHTQHYIFKHVTSYKLAAVILYYIQ